MGWIGETPESGAPGLLQDTGDAIGKPRGKVARIPGVQSLAPASCCVIPLPGRP